MDNNVQDILFEYLKNIIYNPEKASINVEELPEDFRQLGEGMEFLGKCLRENKELAISLSKGDLNVQPPNAENIIAAPLKEIQANLLHITWQAGQVAKGDYGQKLHYMGDFSEAFNTMTEQLETRKNAIDEEHKYIMKQKDTMRDMAIHDQLTGLYNRRYVMEYIDSVVKDNKEFAVSLIDVDFLKYYNDAFGHKTGDEYLIQVARLLEKFPGDRLISRVGGDEFLVIMINSTKEYLEERLRKLRANLMRTRDVGEARYTKGFSYGSSYRAKDSKKPVNIMINEADENMYKFKFEAKRQRKSLVY